MLLLLVAMAAIAQWPVIITVSCMYHTKTMYVLIARLVVTRRVSSPGAGGRISPGCDLLCKCTDNDHVTLPVKQVVSLTEAVAVVVDVCLHSSQRSQLHVTLWLPDLTCSGHCWQRTPALMTCHPVCATLKASLDLF